MTEELRKKIEELLSRSVPYDPLYLRTWLIEAKEVLNELLENDATVQAN